MKKSFLLLNLFCMTQGVIAKKFLFDANRIVFINTDREKSYDPSDFLTNIFDSIIIKEQDIEKIQQVHEAIEKISLDDQSFYIDPFLEQQARILDDVDPVGIYLYYVALIYAMYIDIDEFKNEKFNENAKKIFNSVVCFLELLFNKFKKEHFFVKKDSIFENLIAIAITVSVENRSENLYYDDVQKMLQELKEVFA